MIKHIQGIAINIDNIETIDIKTERVSGFAGDLSVFYAYDVYVVECSMTSGKTISFSAETMDEALEISDKLSKASISGESVIEFYEQLDSEIEDRFNAYLRQFPDFEILDLYRSTVGSEIMLEIEIKGKDDVIEDRYLFELGRDDTPASVAEHFLGEFQYVYKDRLK